MPVRKPKPGESFGDLFPELAKQWHPTKNGNLNPFEFLSGSNKKVWWKCEKGDDHEWLTAISKRSSGSGCSICSNYKIVQSNCLQTTHPFLAEQWHPTKNGNLSPKNIHAGSSKKVWWKCPVGDDHEWRASLDNRSSKNSNCPVCTNQKIVLSNCLQTVNKNLAKEWHPTKNKKLTTFDIGEGSSKIVWWKCDKGDDHEWKASVNSRKNGNGCPICTNRVVVNTNNLSTTHPKLANEWHTLKNGNLSPKDVHSGSSKKVWWQCPIADDHEWITKVYVRKLGSNCPYCEGIKVSKSNCLATLYPDLSKQWHPTKNGKLTPFDFVPGSNKKVWWKCEKGDDHEWRVSIAKRSGGSGCPICSNSKVVLSNSLFSLYPELLSEIDYEKNQNFNPKKIGPGSWEKIWWKCSKGEDHVLKSRIVDRTYNQRKCPMCLGQKVSITNSLSSIFPEIAKQWHPTKNGNLNPSDITSKSGKSVWWQCQKDKEHFWKSKVSNRSNGRNCPYCTLTPQSRQELIITHELITIFKGINPKGFKTRVKGKLRSIDIYIPNLKLGIEFDGSRWHKDKRAFDKLKTEELEAKGFNIIRVRQKPLKRIFKDDVMAEKKYDGKKITNDILTQIMKDYKLSKSTIFKINKYIEKPNLQNEKGLEKYIDMILTEKANKTNTL